MDENNTTPPPNLPEVPKERKRDTSWFFHDNNEKKPYSNAKANEHFHKPTPQEDPKTSIYEDIVDDLVAIIAKLAKELGKKK